MENIPKISVITACYNHAQYIAEMIESVYLQTFREFEMIIVNDGSTDNTVEVLEQYKKSNFRIIHTENNGPARARNLAIENAVAPIILNIDADDKISPDFLERAYNIISNYENIGIVYSEVECIGAENGLFDVGKYSLENMLLGNRIVCNAFFKRSDWENVGGFSENLKYGLEDWDFWLSIIELGREVIKIPERMVYYRTYNNLNSRSGRRKKNRMMMMESLVTIFNRHHRLYAQYPRVFEHYAKIRNKFENENFILRKVRNYYYNHIK